MGLISEARAPEVWVFGMPLGFTLKGTMKLVTRVGASALSRGNFRVPTSRGEESPSPASLSMEYGVAGDALVL